MVHLVSPDNRYDTLYLSNYALLRVKDELARLDGVGDVQVFGAGQFSMRIWLDPEKVASRGLTADDVVRAIREQNIQVAAGQLGAPPLPSATEFQVAINAKGRLTTEDDFRSIIIKTGAAGQVTRLKDVARVELGADTYALRALLDNKAAAAIPIFQRPGSNAIAISELVRAKMQELKREFPQGVDYQIVYDPTVFVRGSIHAVVHTLLEAILLVVLVVIVFLQTWRASVIPLIAVPVSLVGTFAVMHIFGFSLNALSLFGLVLAIGIVVDDAIVVVENVERNIANGLKPIEATRQAMREVTGPIIATALVLCAVFVPTAFISGLTGQFYKQFALTIAISTVISAFNSLTLSPALSALLLKEHGAPPDRLTRILNRLLGGFFRPFNRFFARFSDALRRRRRPRGARRGRRTLCLRRIDRADLLGLRSHADRVHSSPGQAVPGELRAAARCGDPRSNRGGDPAHGRDRPQAAGRRSRGGFPRPEHQRLHQQPQLRHRVRDPQALRRAQVQGLVRRRHRRGAQSAVRQDTGGLHRGVPAAAGQWAWAPSAGFACRSRIAGGLGFEELYKQTQNLMAKGNQTPELQGLFSSYQVNVPQIDAEVDREKAKSQGVSVQELFDTMQVYLGSLYVNDFNAFGRTYPVTAQAEPEFSPAGRRRGQAQDPQCRRRHDPVGILRDRQALLGPRSRHALQLLPHR